MKPKGGSTYEASDAVKAASSYGVMLFHKSLPARGIAGSFVSGMPRRETCNHSPLAVLAPADSTIVDCWLAEAHTPTGIRWIWRVCPERAPRLTEIEYAPQINEKWIVPGPAEYSFSPATPSRCNGIRCKRGIRS